VALARHAMYLGLMRVLRGRPPASSRAATVAAVAFACAVPARAASLSTPVAVIGIETDDAERLAEGLTEAVERAIDKAPGWRKVRVRESLSTLGFAFKCPSRPDAACLDRIAQHLGVELVVWGTMHRAAEGRFDASMHLWRRRGPGSEYTARLVASREPKSDPLVDAQGVACAKNLLSPIRSTLVVKVAFSEPAALRVDGLLRGSVVDGAARVDLEPGPHRVEVARGVEFVAGREVDLRGDEEVELRLEPGGGESASSIPLASAASDVPWKTYAGYGGLGLGGAFGVAAIVEAVRFANAKSDLEQTLALIPRTVGDVCATDTVPNAVNACRSYDEAASARTLGFVFGAVSILAIGGGATLLWQGTQEQASQPRLGFVPRSGGGDLTFTAPLD
jgi:hypothetical protein